MNELKLQIDKKEILYHPPSSWDELTHHQMLCVLKYLPYFMAGESCNDMIVELSGIDAKTFHSLSATQKYSITSLFDYLREEPKMKKLVIESFTHKGVQYVGYQTGFANVTWEEFITAERYFMQNNYAVAAAVLYRQQREKYNGEQDPRVPFSVYGTEKRAAEFKELDIYLPAAIALNYSCLRKTYIANKYKYIFTSGGSGKGENKSFSWINVTRSVLGDAFFEEKKILKSNVHTVLHRMNYLMDPERRRKK